MKNWANTISFEPSKVLAPVSIQEIQNHVIEANKQKKIIRTIGSGHSWTGLIETSDWLMHLDQYSGIINVDKETKIIHAKAGTKLHQFTSEAHAHGYSLANQGDVDKQSLAGATSTGTHGTGIHLQSSSNLIEEMTLVTGEGMLLKVGRNDPWFNAVRLSVGSLGIVAELKMQMTDAYKLKVKSFPMKMDEILEKIDSWREEHRHVEMFYFPVGDWAIVKFMDKCNDESSKRGTLHRLNEVVLENWSFEAFNLMAMKSGKYKFFDKLMRKFVSDSEFVAPAYQAFPTERTVKFREMEYNLPLSDFKKHFADIKKMIKEKKIETLFPIEIRFVKGDDLWLSPASGRDSVYFAFHTYVKEDWQDYFFTIENYMKDCGGRPHWGKWHSLKRADLEKVYPKFSEFMALRNQLDPEGCFLNPHVKEMFV